MIIFKETLALNKYIENQKVKNFSIGFVPTMGALHEGHKSLVMLCRQSMDITVCSIFVNPTQFNDPRDYEKYPATLSTDILQLEAAGCDVLFAPSVAVMYPEGLTQQQLYDLGSLEYTLEGKHRPGHFQGVCQVMERLLHAVQPDMLYLGQKDFQQVLITKKLIKLLGLPVEVTTAATLREPSGLALSSRNMRLTAEQKDIASHLYQNLQFIKTNFSSAAFGKLEDKAVNSILQNGFSSVDYLKIVKAGDLTSVQRWDGTDHLVAVVAATVGGVRIIDNLMLTV